MSFLSLFSSRKPIRYFFDLDVTPNRQKILSFNKVLIAPRTYNEYINECEALLNSFQRLKNLNIMILIAKRIIQREIYKQDLIQKRFVINLRSFVKLLKLFRNISFIQKDTFIKISHIVVTKGKKYGISKICTAVWSADSIAYRCNTCALNANMALCVECFDPDKHKGFKHICKNSFFC